MPKEKIVTAKGQADSLKKSGSHEKIHQGWGYFMAALAAAGAGFIIYKMLVPPPIVQVPKGKLVSRFPEQAQDRRDFYRYRITREGEDLSVGDQAMSRRMSVLSFIFPVKMSNTRVPVLMQDGTTYPQVDPEGLF